MAASIDDITNLVNGFTLDGNATQTHEQINLQSTQEYVNSLQEAIQRLGQSVNTAALHARTISHLANNADIPGCLPLAEVCALHKQLTNLTHITSSVENTVQALKEVTERSIVKQLTSLGNKDAPFGSTSSLIQKLLSHFDAEIKNIVREVLDKADDQDVLWKVAEECYIQATTRCGTLHANNYYDPIDETCLERPYDPDFQSEEYYEHESRREVDEDYAAAFRNEEARRSENRIRDKQGWVEFWIRTLNSSPGGPTLFYPPASLHSGSLDVEVPSYLFRTFDVKSSGTNKASVVASVASAVGSLDSRRTDILSRENEEVAALLHLHLTKRCFGDGKDQDDLMSWTSSLLFAVQYAIWRAHNGRLRPSEIVICAVGTSKFPPGQFMRDTSLLETYRATAKRLEASISSFFGMRLDKNEFYNGEYLSQGTVNLSGRSCTTTLDELIKAGLFKLYPEFEDEENRDRWTYRTRNLRRDWSSEHTTTDREIELALTIGRTCFKQLMPFNIAVVLLAFKNRKLSRQMSNGKVESPSKYGPTWAEKPDEVRRYWIATSNEHSAAKSYDMPSQPHQMLRQMFE